jgi:hypothetical protein
VASVPSSIRKVPVLQRLAWRKACCALALLASLNTLAACSAQQPTGSSYQRQAEMEAWAQPLPMDDSAQPLPANGGVADVIGQMGVAVMSVIITLGNALLVPLLLL